MKKILIVCFLLLIPSIARASVCTGFVTWNTGDTITAAKLNTINTVVAACANNIDNTNIGVLGIFASQIIPTTVGQAVFGGSEPYQFNNDLIVQSSSDASTPLVVNGNSATQSNDIADFFQSSGGPDILAVTPSGVSALTDADSHVVMNIAGHSATQSADLLDISNHGGGAAMAKFAATGNLEICPLINGGNTCARTIPVYTTAGATFASTVHAVQGTASYASAACTQDSQCATSTATLTGAAVFVSTAFQCYATASSSNGGTPYLIASAVAASASTVTLSIVNTGANLGGTTTYGINYLCIGA
jgi:hypothetical protein